jgi:hypothetical protein
MTKLEQKLCELGYASTYDNFTKQKIFYRTLKDCQTRIVLDNEKIAYSSVEHWTKVFTSQAGIDNLQQAFNQLQSDLKELKECENK